MSEVPPTHSAKRINVGCGSSPTLGWLNFDNSPSLRLSRLPLLCRLAGLLGLLNARQRDYVQFCRRHQIHWADATRHLPVGSQSLEVLYSSHMLEHLDPTEAVLFLREARRVLMPCGLLRLVVPDVSLWIADYLSHGNLDHFLTRSMFCIPNPRGFRARLAFALTGSRHHLWGYDAKSLCDLLQRQGFVEVQVMPAGNTHIIEPGALNLREREEESLYVEARAPDL